MVARAAPDRGHPGGARRVEERHRCSSASAPRRARRAWSASAGCSPRRTSISLCSTTSRRAGHRLRLARERGRRSISAATGAHASGEAPKRSSIAAEILDEVERTTARAGILGGGGASTSSSGGDSRPRLRSSRRRCGPRAADASRTAPLNNAGGPSVWFSGLSMNMCATARGAWRGLLRVDAGACASAIARPSPSPVISAADASARYSRRRETASWIRTPAIGARRSAASPSDHRRDRAQLLCRRPPPQKATRRRKSETSAIRPTSTATSVISRTSRFRTWEISCARTPRARARPSAGGCPVVTATYACSGLRPAAKAFGAGSSIT